jgi:acetyl-CoA C-acetyltransferase
VVAAKDRTNALRNPYAHLQEAMSYDDVATSALLWDPIRFHETCPSSDGAAAMVLAAEDVADEHDGPTAWGPRDRGALRADHRAGRDRVDPRAGRRCAADVYREAGISDPRRELDCAELYVPFSWFEPMWLENLGLAPENEGWKLVHDGVTALDGALPINMSGGVLSSNPIGASGMIRFLEAAEQVRGRAGAHQVDGARRALGHAYGGGSQFFAMWIVGSEKP